MSGTKRSAGVVALDGSTDALASRALGLDSRTVTFKNKAKLEIPDNDRSYSTSDIEVSGFSSATEKLKFSMSAKAQRRGDLDVFLRSPSGRIRWINKQKGSNAKNLKIQKADYTKSFSSSSPNGIWQLNIRDIRKGNTATLQEYSLRVSAL
ncbi:MAG: hypothetical protein HC845_01390 [Akkermansiaceae bacterium]|nr:hypothetical protein [Akkermansiaceae bacterium]